MKAALRSAVRGAVLRAGSLLPPRNLPGEVRFFYGHALEEREVPTFRRTLRMLRNRFEFVPMSQAATLAESGEALDGRYLAFSFDDGFLDCHRFIAPTLDEFGASACFFVATRFIECDEEYRRRFLRERLRVAGDKHPMTWSMLRELVAAGFEVGAHTADHLDLAACDRATAQEQMSEAKRTVESRLGVACDAFAWPYGLRQHFPAALLPAARARYSRIYSAMRAPRTFSYGGAVINRDGFEPGWPTAHVRYFAGRRVDRGTTP